MGQDITFREEHEILDSLNWNVVSKTSVQYVQGTNQVVTNAYQSVFTAGNRPGYSLRLKVGYLQPLPPGVQGPLQYIVTGISATTNWTKL